MGSEVLVYVERLRMSGALQESEVRHGIEPPIKRFFSNLSLQLGQRKRKLQDYSDCIEVLAEEYPKALLLTADLMDELSLPAEPTSREDLLQRYIQSVDSDEGKLAGWRRLTVLYARSGDTKGEVHAQQGICRLPTISLTVISEAANRASFLLTRDADSFGADERKLIAGDIADNMRSRMGEANASDCSRLAWLLLKAGRDDEAREWTRKGCDLDPTDEHCQGLAQRLHMLI